MKKRGLTFLTLGMVLVTSMWATAARSDDLVKLQRDWWQWAFATPASHSPIFDRTGNRCGIAQRGDVWFLAGSTGGRVTRSCTVPEGVALLVPVVNTVCYPDASATDEFCVTDSDNFIDSFASGTILLEVDGTPVPTTDVRSEDDFTFSVDANGIFGVKPGVYRATIARGYWGLVGPLSLGPHTVRVVASGPLFGLDVTYLLDVVEPTN